jgi:hypothetical protein
MHNFQITIYPGAEESWPVIAEYRGPDHAQPVRDEGALSLDRTMLLAQPTPLAYGILLGQALFQGAIKRGFDHALGASGDDLHVLLAVEADDLKTLRWERLCACVEDRWDFLALDQRVPFSLALPAFSGRRFGSIARQDLRALLVIASPVGLEAYNLKPFDTTAVLSAMEAALGQIPFDLLATLPGEADLPTLDSMVARFTSGGYTLMHLVCHGSYRPSGETVLYLAKEDGRVDAVSGERLVGRLGRMRSAGSVPHFAFLATCDSASPAAEGALGGLAQRLVRDLGMPAVVGMTEQVPLDQAQALAARFYGRLWEHGQVDRALAEAAGELVERYEPTVPALYSRLGGRPLFRVSTTELPEPEGAAPDLAVVRDLLLAAFTVPDLRRLFLYTTDAELRPLLKAFSPNDGLATMADRAIEYCQIRNLLPNLLCEVQRANPRQYARFAEWLGDFCL